MSKITSDKDLQSLITDFVVKIQEPQRTELLVKEVHLFVLRLFKWFGKTIEK